MKWEYLVTQLNRETFKDEDRLNELGQSGWELVSVDNGIAYFKRPLRTKLEAEILGEFAIPYGEDRSSLT